MVAVGKHRSIGLYTNQGATGGCFIETENEDYLVEDVLQRAFIDETLESQVPKLDFDSYQILESRKGEVNVETYKEMFAKLVEIDKMKAIEDQMLSLNEKLQQKDDVLKSI